MNDSAHITRIVILIAALSLCWTRLMAAELPIADPVKDYLDHPTLDQRVAVTYTRELLRLDLDIVGNNKPITFIAMSGWSQKGEGYNWVPYLPVDGGYRRLTTSKGGYLTFRTTHLFVGPVRDLQGKHGLVTYWSNGRGGEIHAYIFKNSAFEDHKIGSVTLHGEDAKYPAVFKRYFPKAGKPEAETAYSIEHLLLTELSSKGYMLPKSLDD